MTTPSNESQHLETPRIERSVHESPDKTSESLEDDLDIPVSSTFGPALPPPHSASAPELRDSLILEQPSVASDAQNTSPLTASDKLSSLPSTGTLGGRRVGSPNFRNVNQGGSFTFPALGASETSPRPMSNRHLTHPPPERGKPASDPPLPAHRLSIDSDRTSLPSILQQGVRNVISRLSHTSDPTGGGHQAQPSDNETPANRRRSDSQTRGMSPYRFLPPFSRPRPHREEPFIPQDPFKVNTKFRRIRSLIPCLPDASPLPDIEGKVAESMHSAAECHETIFPKTARQAVKDFWASSQIFMIDATRVIYLYALLKLPALYFGRVSRIFIEAEVSQPDIERMIAACQDTPTAEEYFANEAPYSINIGTPSNRQGAFNSGATPFMGGINATATLPFSEDFTPPLVTPALVRFKRSWEIFVDSLTREWKTMNIVSALLLGAQMTMFQVEDAASDPVTRYLALISLMCALMSISYGCVYIVRFSSMKSMVRASRWAEEARKHKSSIFWNLWILLCLPSLWLSWSMILFIASLMSYTWRTGSADDPSPSDRKQPTAHEALAPRIIITLILLLGLFYFILIVRTLRHYGRNHPKRPVDTQPLPPPPACIRSGAF
ncbi:hypothetical protein DL96DRAFT_929606 [Flagelloscypha sp. PMI_526]|nr:hypothetical protein DL96DRAFT_929606 [Flagelloscypha sp. PMI_526]